MVSQGFFCLTVIAVENLSKKIIVANGTTNRQRKSFY